MLRKKLRLMPLILSWALTSCISAPPDFMACADLGSHGHCVTYISKVKSDVSGDAWAKMRAGSVLMPSDQFAKVKTWFDNYCHQNQCPGNVGDWQSFTQELSK